MKTSQSEQQLAHAKAQIQVVLVGTTHSGNIGACARALKNMGLHRLVLVGPRDFPSDEATSRASGADDVLADAKVVGNLDEALATSSLVIGASARTRNLVWPLINPRDCAEQIAKQLTRQTETDPDASVSLLFGRESSGLTNEELQRCHYHVNIPANPEYSSLNLAMAVQVVCYEIRMRLLLELQGNSPIDSLAGIAGPADEGWDEKPATVQEVEGLLVHLEETLVKIGFHDPDNPRMLMVRLRRLLQRAHPDRMEVNILRGMLKTIQKYTGNSSDRG